MSGESRPRRHRGQALVEFALLLPMLSLLLVGITELGLIFYAQVQVSNAAREGTRAATLYIYRACCSSGTTEYTASANDANRGWGTGVNTSDRETARNVAATVQRAFGRLPVTSTTFNPGAYSAPDLNGWEGTADLKIKYPEALDVSNNPQRHDQPVTVRVTYHYRMPFVSALLPQVGSNMTLQAVVTMVIPEN